jgi:hypothetical protein
VRRPCMGRSYSRRSVEQQAAGANPVCLDKYAKSIRLSGSPVPAPRDASRPVVHAAP